MRSLSRVIFPAMLSLGPPSNITFIDAPQKNRVNLCSELDDEGITKWWDTSGKDWAFSVET
jgi:hypothetical protein